MKYLQILYVFINTWWWGWTTLFFLCKTRVGSQLYFSIRFINSFINLQLSISFHFLLISFNSLEFLNSLFIVIGKMSFYLRYSLIPLFRSHSPFLLFLLVFWFAMLVGTLVIFPIVILENQWVIWKVWVSLFYFYWFTMSCYRNISLNDLWMHWNW